MFFIRQNFITVKLPYGEFSYIEVSLQRYLLMAKFSNGEISLRQNFILQIFPWRKCLQRKFQIRTITKQAWLTEQFNLYIQNVRQNPMFKVSQLQKNERFLVSIQPVYFFCRVPRCYLRNKTCEILCVSCICFLIRSISPEGLDW